MSASRSPNILFLIADQQQRATVAPGSPCLMPRLGRLRDSGFWFPNAHTVNSICAPSRASLMTGLYPHNHGMVDNPHAVEEFRSNFQEGRDMISARLKASGYRLGYFGKWHVERGLDPTAFGFDEFTTEEHGRDFPRSLVKSHSISQRGYNDRTLYGVHSEGIEETEEHFFYSQGLDFIRKAARDPARPWCAFISTNAPHDPYIAPKELYELYDPAAIPKPASFDDPMEDKPNIYRRLRQVWKDLDWRNFQEATACYYAACSLVDSQVGRVTDALEESGQLGDTIVVYLSDHGDMMGGHGLLAKGVPAFEESYAIPLVISYPGLGIAGRRCDVPVSVIDLAPTVLDLAGLPPMDGIDGRSVAAAITGRGILPDRSLYAEFYGQRLSCSQRIVWKDGFKYVFNGFDFDELYDLAEDRHEMRNLIGDPGYDSVAVSLAREMWRVAEESGDSSLLDSEYFMFRFAPVGPERKKRSSIYNRGA